MRDFFKQELETLKAKTGLNQYENFSAMVDSEGRSIAAKQIGILLDSMVLACNEFPYIPDFDKCAIIQKMIIQDQDFTALNSRSVWKWLNMHKDVYWTKAQVIRAEEETNHRPLTPEELKDIAIELERRRLAAMGEKTKFPGLDLTMKAIVKEDKERTEKPKGTTYDAPTWTVPVEDDDGKIIKEYSIKAPTMEKAKEILELSIKQGVI